MRGLVIFFFTLLPQWMLAMQQPVFHQGDHRLLVYAGDTVAILADSAYIISTVQANLINQRLWALRNAKETNRTLLETNAELIQRANALESKLGKLLRRMNGDHELVDTAFALLLKDLDDHISFLQSSNQMLSATNKQLEEKLADMDQTLQQLRKANRRIGWQNTRDKIAIGLLAFSLGVLVGL
ncbi:MAG: hypothetical protein HRT61_20240 [Ekhidna sp.]|nr:hypothetical protein [Ekhidna sp.]